MQSAAGIIIYLDHCVQYNEKNNHVRLIKPVYSYMRSIHCSLSYICFTIKFINCFSCVSTRRLRCIVCIYVGTRRLRISSIPREETGEKRNAKKNKNKNKNMYSYSRIQYNIQENQFKNKIKLRKIVYKRIIGTKNGRY